MSNPSKQLALINVQVDSAVPAYKGERFWFGLNSSDFILE